MEENKLLDKKKLLTPKLRFKGFDKNWNSKKVNDLAEINPSSKNLPDKFIYIDLESVVKGQLLKENEILKNGSPSRAQRYLQQNDILFQMVRPYQMNNLFFSKNGEYVASTGYAQIRTKENAKFIYQYLHLQNFVDKVIERCTGTSYPSINSSDLGNIQISIPTLPEQQKIASFLSAVDEKIQRLTRKKELLVQYKKGVMQQLFSGKLRFKDEKGNEFPTWEEKLLDKLFTYRNGGRFEDDVSEDGEIILISLNSVDIEGNLKNSQKKVNINIKETDKMLSKGELVMVLSDVAYGNLLGLSAIIPENDKYVLNYRMGALKARAKINTFFIAQLINHNQRYFKLHGQGSSQLNLTKADVLKFTLYMPILEEQKKIANYLSNIESKIEAVNKQITQTQTFKKGLLQQMFV